MQKEFDIFGIGHPLIDIFIETEDHHLIELELEKGRMHLIDSVKFEDMQQKLKKEPLKTSIAGDVVNTIMGVASMGGRAVFCGKVGKDSYAGLFEGVLASDRIKPVLAQSSQYCTGRVISFVTKDSQRTMITYPGAAVSLKKEEAVFDDIKHSAFLYASGYALDTTDLKETVFHAMDVAKEEGVKIAFDLADPGVISRHKEEIGMIIKDYADIVFANEAESRELTGKPLKKAISQISGMCEIAVVKLGEHGSIIKKGGLTLRVNIRKEQATDSTGAGDMYAAGFLYALSKTDDLKIAADIASFAASKIVRQFGARLEEPIKEEVEDILGGRAARYPESMLKSQTL